MDRRYVNRLGRGQMVWRMVWGVVWTVGARWLPRSVGSGWKRFLLRLFGARMGRGSVVYSSARVYWPGNLVMGDFSCLAEGVNCYNVDVVSVGDYATVSQGATLCTASHDIESGGHELLTGPVEVGAQAWVAAEAFVGMGVRVGEGAVVGARAAVFRDVEGWTVVGGNPARFLKKRVIRDA